MNRWYKTKNINRPMQIVVVYLITTLALYVIGPFQWVTYKPVYFWILNISYIIMFICGWHLGSRMYVSKHEWDEEDDSRIIKRLRYLIFIEFVFEFISALRKFQILSLSPVTLVTNILDGIFNMGESYNRLQSSIDDVNAVENAFGGAGVTLFNLFWSFLGFNILMLGLLYFKKLSRYNKIVLIITYVLIIGVYVATGTNIGVFRVLLIFAVFFAIHLAREEQTRNFFKSKKTKRIFFLIVAVSIVASLVLFDKIMQSRGGILFWEASHYNIGGVHIDRDSILFKILPSSIYMLLVSVSGYLTQGYYGMSLCLQIPWEPGFGVGHSMALMNMLPSFFAVPHENTYQYRLTQFGWEEGQQWHTMYSWFANDIGFIGVIIVMFLIGFAFSIAYRDSIMTNNPYAKLVTYYFGLLAFFIPCNNQLFQTTYILFAFVTALICWLATRGRRRIVIKLGGTRL